MACFNTRKHPESTIPEVQLNNQIIEFIVFISFCTCNMVVAFSSASSM